VCHDNFKAESLAASHAVAGVGCDTCHGESDEHSEDEGNITPPDILYARDAVDPFCVTCHPLGEIHDSDEYRRAVGDSPAPSAGCTECHGEHRMAQRTVRWDPTTREATEVGPGGS